MKSHHPGVSGNRIAILFAGLVTALCAALSIGLSGTVVSAAQNVQSAQETGSPAQNIQGTGSPAQIVLMVRAGVFAEEVKKIAESVAAAAAEPYRDKPDIDTDEWMYILANPWNEIGDYTPELASLEGQQFDERIVDDMEAFAEAARAEGLSVFLSSGYRGYDMQSYLYRRKVDEYGEAVAQTIVARPGTSEHQTGLCCDITDRYYEEKGWDLENTALYQWMSRHCQEYGFIVRFPKGKEDVTGIIYEPWHFRYVGVEAATYIMEHDLTLEEFLELYE